MIRVPVLESLRLPKLVPLVIATATMLGGCAPDYADTYDAPYASSSGQRRTASLKSKIPLPDRAQLSPQAEPDCGGTQPQRSAALAAPSIQDDATADMTLRIKLEYERECFRQAEMRVRQRLDKLQASTAETIKAVKADQARDR